MYKRLNPLEKELLIRLFRSNPEINLTQFCKANSVTPQSFRKWMKQYDAAVLEGLARSDKDFQSLLPEGTDPTIENYKREILKLTIENERLKKNYVVRKTKDGEIQMQHLEAKNTK
jgi:transposase-like protein